MPKTISMEGKATIHHATRFQDACLAARADDDPVVELDWAGSLGIDTSILQLLIALSREKQIRGVGDPGKGIREALAIAGFDPNLKPISNPE
jgi:hypothetical protein